MTTMISGLGLLLLTLAGFSFFSMKFPKGRQAMSGMADAAILVPLHMGANPVLAVVAGLAVGGYGILPGFLAGYVIGLVAPIVEKKLPEGLNIILGALAMAPLARIIALGVDPVVTAAMAQIGTPLPPLRSSPPW